MREQKLTVSGLFRQGWHALPDRQRMPLLQLVGPWLEEVGFHIGAEVKVRAEEGRLEVVLREAEAGDDGGGEGW